MLDTNTAGYIIKGKPAIIREHLRKVSMAAICISSITQAELLLGAARKLSAKHLPVAVNEFSLRVDILPWDSSAAEAYAWLRKSCEDKKISLGAMDMLIAAHAVAVSATLITNDKSFFQIGRYVSLADWTTPFTN